MIKQVIKLNILGIPLKIKTDQNAFTPSPHGSKALGSVIKINKGEKVLDVGCGTGFLAILAAKMGGIVKGTDILKNAIKLSKQNAIENKVNIDFRIGNLFSSFEGEVFDVIIANIPQELLSPKIRGQWDKEKIISYSGGKSGSEVLIKTLSKAKKHMHKKSRLYIVVYTMTNYRKSLGYIVNNYSAKLINFYNGPVKNFVYEDPIWYENNKDILIYKKAGKYFADLFTFELRLKN